MAGDSYVTGAHSLPIPLASGGSPPATVDCQCPQSMATFRASSVFCVLTSQDSFLLPECSLLPPTSSVSLRPLGSSGLLPGAHPPPHPPWAPLPFPRLPLLTSVLTIPSLSWVHVGLRCLSASLHTFPGVSWTLGGSVWWFRAWL